MTPQNTSRSAGWPPQRTSRLRLNSESGGTLIETALAMSLLLAFLFGIIEVSLALYSYHFISDAAREGTRYAMVRGSTWQTSPWDLNGGGGTCATYSSAGCQAVVTNKANDPTDDVQSYVKSLAFPGIDPSKMTITTSYTAPPGGPPCTICTAAGDMVQVQVQYTFPFSLPFVPMTKFTMSSTSEMLIAQ